MKNFKKILVGTIIGLTSLLAACSGENRGGQQTEEPPLSGESNVLIAYFSWSSSNNTQVMAGYIKDKTGGELFRIVPETAYTTDYDAVIDIAEEERNQNARPALKTNLTEEQFNSYDVIFIGYPIWWYDAPMIIYTFVESHDFAGKTIIPFATSGGSGLSGSDDNIQEICTGATVLDGLVLRGSNIRNLRSNVETWIDGLGLTF